MLVIQSAQSVSPGRGPAVGRSCSGSAAPGSSSGRFEEEVSGHGAQWFLHFSPNGSNRFLLLDEVEGDAVIISIIVVSHRAKAIK